MGTANVAIRPFVAAATPSNAGAPAPATEDHRAEDVAEEDDDPLLELFRAHGTHRVQFDLSSSPPAAEDPPLRRTSTWRRFRRGGGTPARGARETPSSCLRGAPGGERGAATQKSQEAEDALRGARAAPSPARRSRSLQGWRGGAAARREPRSEGGALLPSAAKSSKETEEALVGRAPAEPAPVCRRGSLLGRLGATRRRLGDKQRRSPPPSAAIPVDSAHEDAVAKLLRKAERARATLFRYRLAMKYYLLALKELKTARDGSEDGDAGDAGGAAAAAEILQALNDVHHAQSTLESSARIVRLGIEHEDRGQLAKALRRYTIAYRMRRDVLGADHPSLAALLNLMGSVQVKRGERGEALRLYELSLRGLPEENGGRGRKKEAFRNANPLSTSVTLRDMGMILEQQGDEDKGLKFYHASLRYAVKYQRSCQRDGHGNVMSDEAGAGDTNKKAEEGLDPDTNAPDDLFSLQEVRPAASDESALAEEEGGTELILDQRFDRWASPERVPTQPGRATTFYYDELFATAAGAMARNPSQRPASSGDPLGGPDVDIAMTLHQIGQIHRRRQRYAAARSAYGAALRGMREVFGAQHGHVAAVLGNIGNLCMETGDYDEAFDIYQEVLGIETLDLGLSHPEVAVTLHNIATIECHRGNLENGVSLYKQVADMQKIRYGNEHLTVAITLSCLADAHEKLRDIRRATATYEEALRIRAAILGPSHLDVGRLRHKLGQLAAGQREYVAAQAHATRAAEIYESNRLPPDHAFWGEIHRDVADIRAALALARKQ